ncbi:hypothetical protein [Citrobacter amalonaticus]|uniref:hypothetical protein n=1 Tax=Citrobacter amalonaticus TaxID=35703 RepID=UPI00255AF9BD|nr:hypothetical protein [Citrobacter amalonaticus]MDL4616262.1 hypothetical protein [Citrobacter amalonaticus]MDL4620360.1 hypothetical protein [Citrobacter amalonaticus]
MKKIIIKSDLNESDYAMYSITWDKEENVYIDTSNLKNMNDIVHCANLALSMPQRNFSMAVLENLAEIKNIPMDILEKIILTGDTGCCESVCMRTDLNYKLRRICGDLELAHKTPENKQ